LTGDRARAGRGTALAFDGGMVGVHPLDACARIDGPTDTGLGRYQSLAVAVIVGLILALLSVADVTLPLR